jgi:hypothetical protein
VSAALVAIGTVLLWPLLARRHGRGVAIATLVALVFGTVVYSLARGPWTGGLAFAIGAAVLRVVAPRLRVPVVLSPFWLAAAVIALVICVLRGAGPDAVLDALFSSWGGLLFWSPILWLGIAGCLRDGRSGPAGVLAPVLLIALALGADGAAAHGAQFAPILPLLGLGLGRALDTLRAQAMRRPLVPIVGGLALLALWNALLMAQYRDGGIPRDDTVAFPRVARNAAATVSTRVGSPVAWPANWIFAARNGVRPDRYDVLGGVDVFAAGDRGMSGAIDIGDAPTDEAVLREGWSVRHRCGVAVCRAVEGRASLLVPIQKPRDADVSVIAAGTGSLTLSVNGVAVQEAPLTADLRPLAVRVPGARFRRGLNTLSFTATGEALVDRLVFTEAAR